MNINNIKEIVNSDKPDREKEKAILRVLAEDRDVIPTIMRILQIEREETDKLHNDYNAELSRALVSLDNEKVVSRIWVIQQIKAHYIKWKHRIRCCYKFDDLP